MSVEHGQGERDEIIHLAIQGIETAADRLHALGCTDHEIGRALFAVALSRLSRSMTAADLVDELANLTGSFAYAAGIDLFAEPIAPSTTH